MFDIFFRRTLDPISEQIINITQLDKIKPTTITLTGFAIGCCAAPFIIAQHYLIALVFILINRILDGFDGLVAKRNMQITALGGYLDITCDFIFYALIVLSFGFADAENAQAALLLLFSFIACGISFLAHGLVMKDVVIKKTYKLFDYIGGLAEGAETIFFFSLFCLFPMYFNELAITFTVMCMLTALYRTYMLTLQHEK